MEIHQQINQNQIDNSRIEFLFLFVEKASSTDFNMKLKN